MKNLAESHKQLQTALRELVKCIRNFELGDYSPLMDEIFDAEQALKECPPSDGPELHKLGHPVHVGDWHDKPLRWNVVWGTKNQMFSTKKDAEKYLRIWRRNNGDELASINEYQATRE